MNTPYASRLAGCILLVCVAGVPAPGYAQQYSGWSLAAPVLEINTPANDGCPIEAPDGLELYIASNRPGTLGGNDIWVAGRPEKDMQWSPAQNLGTPVNSLANDFCPTPLNGGWLMYVSERPGAETCNAGPGKGDMYLIRNDGRSAPLHLGCASSGAGPNTNGIEFSPSLVSTGQGTWLFFSSDGYTGNMDIVVSAVATDGSIAPGVRVNELSTVSDDRMPNVRKDGLEIGFSSNRPGGFGGQDVYIAVRGSVDAPWSAPVNAGPNVNTAGNETRASFSSDGTRLYFGRDGDVYTSSRENIFSVK